jgi:hypothetical protein
MIRLICICITDYITSINRNIEKYRSCPVIKKNEKKEKKKKKAKPKQNFLSSGVLAPATCFNGICVSHADQV